MIRRLNDNNNNVKLFCNDFEKEKILEIIIKFFFLMLKFNSNLIF
jgi:hypothetical protein